MTSPDLRAGTVLLPRDDLAWRNVAGKTVIVDMDGNVVLGLNRTGGATWDLLDGVRSLADVARRLAARYDRAVDDVLSDVIAFGRALIDRGLVRVVAAPEAEDRT